MNKTHLVHKGKRFSVERTTTDAGELWFVGRVPVPGTGNKMVLGHYTAELVEKRCREQIESDFLIERTLLAREVVEIEARKYGPA